MNIKNFVAMFFLKLKIKVVDLFKRSKLSNFILYKFCSYATFWYNFIFYKPIEWNWNRNKIWFEQDLMDNCFILFKWIWNNPNIDNVLIGWYFYIFVVPFILLLVMSS